MKKMLAITLLVMLSSSSFASDQTYYFFLVSAGGQPVRTGLSTKSGVPIEHVYDMRTKDGRNYHVIRVKYEYGPQKICYKGQCKSGVTQKPMPGKFVRF